jgi:hypothetical protein
LAVEDEGVEAVGFEGGVLDSLGLVLLSKKRGFPASPVLPGQA